MKKLKKMMRIVLPLMMVLGVALAAPAEKAEAAVSAKSLVASALNYMKSYEMISYTYNHTKNVDGTVTNRVGMATSDSKVDHGFYLDKTQSDKGWEEYMVKNHVYRKNHDATSWTTYTITDYDSKSIDSYSDKKYFQYLLGHLKNVKITSWSQKSYTLTAKPNFFSDIKKVTLTINRKKKCITGIKLAYKTYTDYYLSSTSTFTVKNSVVSYSNICYGKSTIGLPDGL
jgi:hypothetical protein